MQKCNRPVLFVKARKAASLHTLNRFQSWGMHNADRCELRVTVKVEGGGLELVRGRGGCFERGPGQNLTLSRSRERRNEGRNRLLRAPFDSIDPPCWLPIDFAPLRMKETCCSPEITNFELATIYDPSWRGRFGEPSRFKRQVALTTSLSPK